MSQDRDLVEEERQARLAASAEDRPRASSARGGMDAGTKKLAIVAGGLGGVLVLMVGGWSLLGHRPSGIPILSPPPGPVRVKPLDPGGMQLMGTQVAPSDDGGPQALAPGPEEAKPQALQAEVDRAREADKPPSPPTPAPAAPVVPAPVAVPAAAPSAVPTPVPDATPLPAPKQMPEAAAPSAADGKPGVSASETEAPAPGSGHHAVQLAALDSEAAARSQWAQLAHRAPSLFAGRQPVISSVQRNGKQFFRLRTGGFGSVAAATSFCAEAKQAGIACTLADF